MGEILLGIIARTSKVAELVDREESGDSFARRRRTPTDRKKTVRLAILPRKGRLFRNREGGKLAQKNPLQSDSSRGECISETQKAGKER